MVPGFPDRSLRAAAAFLRICTGVPLGLWTLITVRYQTPAFGAATIVAPPPTSGTHTYLAPRGRGPGGFGVGEIGGAAKNMRSEGPPQMNVDLVAEEAFLTITATALGQDFTVVNQAHQYQDGQL